MTPEEVNHVRGLLLGGQQRYSKNMVQQLIEHIEKQELEIERCRQKVDPETLPGWVAKFVKRRWQYTPPSECARFRRIAKALEEAVRGER